MIDLSYQRREEIVVSELEWLLKYEQKIKPEEQDIELINSLLRVVKEYKPLNVEIKK